MSRKVPFGYILDNDGHLKVHEDEAMLVREIFRLFINYQSINRVCEGINNSDLFPENEHKFNPTEVNSILNNVFYAGHLVYRNSTDNKPVVVAFNHHGIVPSEVWEEVQELLVQQEEKY